MDSKSISKALGIRQETEKLDDLDIANEPNDDDEDDEEVGEVDGGNDGISAAMDVGDIGETEIPTRFISQTVLSGVVPSRNRKSSSSNNNPLKPNRAYLFSLLILFQKYV